MLPADCKDTPVHFAILDSGIYEDHPVIKGKIAGRESFVKAEGG